jgi:hypothetical protein
VQHAAGVYMQLPKRQPAAELNRRETPTHADPHGQAAAARPTTPPLSASTLLRGQNSSLHPVRERLHAVEWKRRAWPARTDVSRWSRRGRPDARGEWAGESDARVMPSALAAAGVGFYPLGELIGEGG